MSFMTRWLRRSWLGLCYAGAILTSAFLVFQVQLLISKSILPWFGGTPAVWTTCMLFFQVVLFAGYAYAHGSIARLKPAHQGLVHLTLILLAIALLPVTPSDQWKPADSESPVLYILGLLAICVGFPYFVLSATGPLIQGWFARTHQGRSPYRLYALSNVGSLLGLVSYPFLVEPELPLTSQSAWWSAGFTLFALFCGCCALRAWKRSGDSAIRTCSKIEATERPTWRTRLAWLGLAGYASVMLLATTNHVCQDVAVIPFLWVLPLTLYLLTFIICFEKESWYSRRWCGGGAALFVAATAALLLWGNGQNLLLELSVCMAALFLVCLVCHGELIRRKPSPRRLTEFYLMTSAGGAAGGVCVALIAPQVFATHAEFTLSLLAGYLLAVAVVFADFRGKQTETPPPARSRLAWIAMFSAFVGCLLVVRCQTNSSAGASRWTARSFYGVLHVDDVDRDDEALHGLVLRYGRILHGYQRLSPELRREPTLYYDRQSGVGLTIEQHPRRSAGLRIGAVGLGVGTIAAYGREADYYRFYEINPDVVQAARQEFSYLRDCPCPTEVVLGDARLSLEREPPQRFDVLALDAFSGDAIPTHLLTREAFEIYLRHLAPDGALAVHITNRHVDLTPVLQALALHYQLHWVRIDSPARLEAGVTASSWALLSRSQVLLQQPAIQAAAGRDRKDYALIPLWTDDYSNIFQILR